MKNPVIGITAGYDYSDAVARASGRGTVGQDFNFLAEDYIRAVEKAGGVPLMIPIFQDTERLKALLSLCDGILLSGGNDIDPQYYGERLAFCGTIAPQRDAQELFIAKYAVENRKAVLGICRGIQVLNVALGGTLYQDVEKQGGYRLHSGAPYPRNVPWHTVQVEPESRLHDIFGSETIRVNSFHHQAVKDTPYGLCVTARSEDGVIEAIEKKNGAFTLAVQWHPEMMFDSDEQAKIFRAFVAAAAE